MDERIQEGSFKQPSFKPQQRPGKARRAAVSAEKTMAAVKGKRSSSVVDITTAPKGPPKPDEVVAMLRKAVDSCLLFGGMTLAQCDVVINTMLPHSFSAGDCMIEQGTSSSDDLHFYIVGKGTFDIHRKETPSSASKLVQQCVKGDSFGELSLMYNQPRQATVTCTSANATLWGLQRSKFQGIQQLTAMDVQAKMVSALEAVPLLKASLDSEQLHRLADSFEEVSYQADERIIVQGDVGDSFYVILEGQVHCISESSGQVVMELGRGDYFGERALLKDDPRAVHSLTYYC
jgi:CRP-like cAMP-binding protein